MKLKKYIFILILIITNINLSFAEEDKNPCDGKTLDKDGNEAVRCGNFELTDIPNIINSVINFFMGVAGTVAIIFIIIGAYKILLGSLEQDKTKGKDTIIMAIGGFIIAALAGFIIKFIIDNFS